METVYRMLGLSASISERLSRTRGNGIPLNWLIVIFVGMVGCFAAYEVREALVNSRTPEAVALSAVIGRGDMEDHYVRTDGQFAPDSGLMMSKKGSDDPDKVYIPIVDVTTRSAVFVELDPDPKKKPAGLDANHVSGMVRKLDSRLKNELGKTTQKVADIPIDTSWMIVAGDEPARAWIWIPVAGVLWLVVLLMVLPIGMRYVVFRRTAEPVETGVTLAPQGAEADVVRMTGRFSFGPKVRQRFHNMPAVIAELEGGMVGLVTQTDASVKYMGQVTQERKGMWLIPIRTGTLSAPEFGRYYGGGAGRVAFRARYVDDATGKREWAILAFESVRAMGKGREALYRVGAEKAEATATPQTLTDASV